MTSADEGHDERNEEDYDVELSDSKTKIISHRFIGCVALLIAAESPSRNRQRSEDDND